MLDLAAHRKDRTVAFIAMLVLVLQSLLASWSATAAPLTLDSFGNPLCITHADGDQAPAQTPSPAGCCTMGCAASIALLDIPEFSALPLVSRIDRGGVPVAAVRHLPARIRPGEGPGSPRAPPPTN